MARRRKVSPGPGIREILAEDRSAQELLGLVTRFLSSLGGVESVARKTQISFKHGRAFAWVWLPRMWIKKQPRGSITLTFGLDHQVRDRRIKQSVQPYPGRFTHHVVITKPAEFDEQVKDWLREAHRAAEGARRTRRQQGPGDTTLTS